MHICLINWIQEIIYAKIILDFILYITVIQWIVTNLLEAWEWK